MVRSIETESENVDSEQQWSFICRSAANPELVAAVEGLHITDPFSIPIQFSHPADGYFLERPNTKRVDANVTARWLVPDGQTLSELDEIAVCFHGFGCAHTEDHNYFSALVAVMGISALSVDLPGFNTNEQDAKLFAHHHWMGDIDQYPYMILQVLENMLCTESIRPLENSIQPLQLNILAHSVSARSLLVSASLNDGALLKAIEYKWSRQLGREVKFILTALEPAFALHPDSAISAVGWLYWGMPHWMLSHTPSVGLVALRMLLSTLTQTYGLVNADSYPLSSILIRERLDRLLEHPSQICQAPTKPISSIETLQQNFSTVVVLALKDTLVNNRATATTLLADEQVVVDDLLHLLVSVETKGATTSVIINEKPTSEQKAQAVYGINAGHVVELEHPEVMSVLIRDGHRRLHR